MTAQEELTNLVLRGQNGAALTDMAAFLLEIICKEHKFQQNASSLRKALHEHTHYWGNSIFGPILQQAGLLRVENKRYVPTQKGLEIYEQLLQEGYYHQRQFA